MIFMVFWESVRTLGIVIQCAVCEIALKESERRAKLVNEETYLSEDTRIILDFISKEVFLAIPLQDFVLFIGNLEAKFGCGGIFFISTQPEFLLHPVIKFKIIE